MKTTGLIRYDAMVQAIAQAHDIDEVKDIRDKAIALERYAQQAMNMDAERKALEIRLRAEKKAGRLLKEMKANGERVGPKDNLNQGVSPKSCGTTSGKTLTDLGITRDQSSKWQKLDSVPEEDFEAALANPDKKPSTSLIITNGAGENIRVDYGALWLWGWASDFSKHPPGDPAFLCKGMTPTMITQLKRYLPDIIAYLKTLKEHVNERY